MALYLNHLPCNPRVGCSSHVAGVRSILVNIEFKLIAAKGQIILKGLFDVLELSQKMNDQIRSSSKNEFVCSFFGRIQGDQKSFGNYLTFTGSKFSKISASVFHPFL